MSATATCEMGVQLSLWGDHDPIRGERPVFVPAARVSDMRPPKRPVRQINNNSLSAHDKHADEHSGRKWLILGCIKFENKPMTARAILNKLFPGRDDMNLVRPRLTELVAEGKLVVVGNVIDDVTGETVGLYWLA